MNQVIEFINRLLAGIDPQRFFGRYVPILVLLGAGLLIGTFLGPIGVLIVAVAIAGLVYFLYQSLTGRR